jgi:hypothetical protein
MKYQIDVGGAEDMSLYGECARGHLREASRTPRRAVWGIGISRAAFLIPRAAAGLRGAGYNQNTTVRVGGGRYGVVRGPRTFYRPPTHSMQHPCSNRLSYYLYHLYHL